MAKIKVGVTGVGVLGAHHARLYRALDGAELIGVFDEDSERAREIAAQNSTLAFESVAKLTAAVDCMSVAVPTDRHFSVVQTMLSAGTHVLVEKPLTDNVEEGRRLIELARQQKRVLHVGHVERYNPVITYLEEKLTNPRFIEAHRLAPYPPARPGLLPRGTEVGVVMDLMIHDIDIILNLVKSDVRRLDAVGIPILSRSEDIANVRVTFENGCVANLTASRVSQERIRKIRVFQPDSYLSLDYQDKKGEVVLRDGEGIHREPVPIENNDALETELRLFIESAAATSETEYGAAGTASAEAALRALTIADEITKMINDGIAENQQSGTTKK